MFINEKNAHVALRPCSVHAVKGNLFYTVVTAVCSEDCDVNAICAYVDNGTKCVCTSGYTGNGYSCKSKYILVERVVTGLLFSISCT